MAQQQVPPAVAPAFGLLGVYLKRGMAVIIGVALAIGLYLYVIKDQPAAQGIQQATVMCSCPSCGTMIEKPAGLDCEELNCPSCGSPMGTAAMLAAAPGAGVGAPVTQNQRETLAEQGGGGFGGNVGGGTARLVRAPTPVAPAEGAVCICPNCGKQIKRQPGVDCSMVVCPNCHSQMTNPVYVGTAGQQVPGGEMLLAGMAGNTTPAQRNAGAVAPCPHTHGAVTAPACPSVGGTQQAAPCPGVAGGGLGQPPVGGGFTPAAATPAITYSDTIRPILEKNCYRCHSGPMRNLTSYSSVKSYADSGLLLMMTQPGGPMSRFLSANEYHTLESWSKSGAAP